jgi:hypothetical protein
VIWQAISAPTLSDTALGVWGAIGGFVAYLTIVVAPELDALKGRRRLYPPRFWVRIVGWAVIYVVAGVVAAWMVGDVTTMRGQAIAFGASGVATLKGAAATVRAVT